MWSPSEQKFNMKGVSHVTVIDQQTDTTENITFTHSVYFVKYTNLFPQGVNMNIYVS